ncbi:aldehyde dehydrogenase (NADP(+)) [Nocardioides sp. BYT-33-1]|uniref:aldehyde dehydrogenase (NADP(+)) n=1 Tax=Nocardioides sp. BYT-33-1 TaxID=3416952 RepID=UPI003F535C44
MTGPATTVTTVPDTAPADVDAVVAAAAAAARPWRSTAWDDRAHALERVADALDAHADRLVALAAEETHLLEGRLRGELTRTTFQLRFFAGVVRTGRHAGAAVDHADAAWPMGVPRPDLRRHVRALGPVVVFAASNFPFAFSVAGGDTASALAAGCPVVVKAHPGHPRLSSATADLVHDALSGAGAPEGVFALIHGTDAGRQALLHPAVRAASFTGSIAGGRALFDLAAARPQPIPFYGELGSTNPVVVTPAAGAARPGDIADGFVAAVTGSAGQLCTKPGLLFVPEHAPLLDALAGARLAATHPLLNERIDRGFRDGLARLRRVEEVEVLSAADDGDAVLLGVDAAVFARQVDVLGEECFGPASLVVRYRDEAEVVRLLASLPGQLTTSVFAEAEEASTPYVRELVDVAAERAGRVLWNQWPTGLSVTWAQQHGGPYPATTDPRSTSVGASAIDRFLRPVAFQGLPDALLPGELRDEPVPPAAARLVDGS